VIAYLIVSDGNSWLSIKLSRSSLRPAIQPSSTLVLKAGSKKPVLKTVRLERADGPDLLCADGLRFGALSVQGAGVRMIGDQQQSKRAKEQDRELGGADDQRYFGGKIKQ